MSEPGGIRFDDGTEYASSADVRHWAAGENIEFAPKGKLSPALVERFESATGRTYQPGTGHPNTRQDWSGQAPAAPPAGEGEAGEPRQRAPRPARISTRKAPAKAKKPKPVVTADLLADIEAKLAMFFSMGGLAWERRDLWCGGKALDVAPDVARRLAPIICQSADLVAWFTSSGKYMLWLDLMAAVQPLAEVMWQHHVTHEIGEQEGGEVEPAPGYGAYVPATGPAGQRAA